jgi:Pex14 N-terminal domain
MNPRVSSRPKSEKEAFLIKKGLTTAEIIAAFAAAGVSDQVKTLLNAYKIFQFQYHHY